MEQKISKMYEVLRDDSVNAYNYYMYSVKFDEMCKLNEGKYSAKARFIKDMYMACQNSYAMHLMKIYDKRKDTLHIDKFLRTLKKSLSDLTKESSESSKYIALIDNDLKELSETKTVDILRKIRNNKYSHNSLTYAQDHQVIDPLTKMLYKLDVDEIKELIDLALDIVKNYQALFDIKNIELFLMSPDSMKDIFSLVENYCWSGDSVR